MAVYSLEPTKEDAGGSEGGVQEGERKERKKVTYAPNVPDNFPLPNRKPEARVEKRSERKSEQMYETVLEKVRRAVPAGNSPQDKQAVKDDVDEIAKMDADSRVERLTNIALKKSPDHAFKVAREIDDLYTTDKLHDTLSFELFEQLSEKGIV